MRQLAVFLPFLIGCVPAFDDSGSSQTSPMDDPLTFQWEGSVAVGGSAVLTVEQRGAIGVEVVADNPRFTLTEVAAPAGELRYLVTTTERGSATITASSQNQPDRVLTIHALPVESVRLVPDTMHYQQLATELAWHTSLNGATIDIGAVDHSMELRSSSDDAIELDDWNHLTLPRVPGTYSALVHADSFGGTVFTIDVVDTVERIDAVFDGTFARVGDEATVCFHPMVGDREVRSAFTTGILISGGASSSPYTNCRHVKATAAGVLDVSARAYGAEVQRTFEIAP